MHRRRIAVAAAAVVAVVFAVVVTVAYLNAAATRSERVPGITPPTELEPTPDGVRVIPLRATPHSGT